MGNSCIKPFGGALKKKGKKIRKPPIGNHKLEDNVSSKLVVLNEPTGHHLEERYELGRELGRGEFGITYLCSDKSNGEMLACKKIPKMKLETPVDIEDVRREATIMQRMLNHPNIVSLKGTYEDNDTVNLVMELCEGGELFDRIVSRGHYSEREAAVLIRTIVEVVQACHKNGVIHRDLKPENFLFTNKKETAPLKAIDFGLSVTFEPGQKFTEIVGSPFYMAPEVLKRDYGHEVDIWSAGIILYILLSGVPPFWAENEQDIAIAVLNSPVDFKREPWPRVSDSAKDLVKKMLNRDPTQRLTAEQVLDHPWFQNVTKPPTVSSGETTKKARPKQNKLMKRAIKVIAENLSEDEVAGCEEGFALMDVRNRGKIDIFELTAGFRKIGYQISCTDLQDLMEAGDADKDGFLDYTEFVTAAVHLEKIGDDDYLQQAFAFFDENESGFIEREEVRTSLADELDIDCEQVVESIIQDVDADKDGKISYDEFATMMKAWSMCKK